ncbi:hypothetical protein OK016_21930 [Vibrio chagasii]|nr:hypothetical protein [Vibrio chagasii]
MKMVLKLKQLLTSMYCRSMMPVSGDLAYNVNEDGSITLSRNDYCLNGI